MMKRLVTFFTYMLLTGMGMFFLYRSDRVTVYSDMGAELLELARYSPYFFAAIAVFVAFHYNRSGVLFLAVFLAGTYYSLRNGMLSPDHFPLIVYAQSLCFLIAAAMSERGLLSFFGILKAFLFSFCFVFMLFLGRIETIVEYAEHNGSEGIASHLEAISAFIEGNISIRNWTAFYAAIGMSAGVILLPSYGQREEKSISAPVTALCLLVAIVLFSRLIYTEGVRPDLLFAAAFSTQILLLIVFLYFSAWNKAYTDPLTDLPNRRAFDDAVAKLGKNYTITMIDIDRFKNVNDRYGHKAGDDVLRHVGKALAKYGKGRAYRYGGEEFAFVQPRTTSLKAADAMDAMRKKIASQKIGLKHPKTTKQRGKKIKVTISAGIASSTQFRTTAGEVIEAADKALYRAKKGGRNRVEVERRKRPR